MKIIICGLLFLSLSGSAMAFHFTVSFGLGAAEEKKENVCQTSNTKDCGTVPKPAEKVLPATGTKKASPVSTAMSVKKAETTPKKTNVKQKPVAFKKAEESLKINKKRDWSVLSTESIGAFGATYGARKSDWVIGSIGTAVLLYGMFSDRNTNSVEEQVLAISVGIGGGYLPKISSDKEDNKASNPVPTPLPPPPAP